jgi:PAS domain S-box-containing protein
MKTGFLDKLIERFDKLDSRNLQTLLLRLWREKGLLESVFNVLYDGVIVLDASGQIAYANSAAARMLGFSIEAVIQQPVSKYLKDIDWLNILKFKEQDWTKLISREIEITYPEKRFINMYIIPVPFAEKDLQSVVIILRDITGEREKEIKALKSERLNILTLLAASVAHEIGNPLNSLHIHLQLLEREIESLPGESRKKIEDLIAVAGKEVQRLNVIITQFLKAIRPSPPDKQLCRIEDILKETISFMKYEIENRDVIVEVKETEQLPPLSVDHNQIKQAFFNIIKNALQAMSGGGILSITFFTNDRFLGVSFKDNGQGMSAEQIGRLFKPYLWTGKPSAKTDGSGLGLFIVQRIIQDHGGEIEVYSQPKGGTTFTLLLPLVEKPVKLLKAPRKRRIFKSNS